jgi:hypothetical protein
MIFGVVALAYFALVDGSKRRELWLILGLRSFLGIF